LRELKHAVIENMPDHHPIRIGHKQMTSEMPEMRLAALRTVLTITPGQKIAYVTDAADTAANRDAIVKLVQNADMPFIEVGFAGAELGGSTCAFDNHRGRTYRARSRSSPR
jgi:ribonuclease Z